MRSKLPWPDRVFDHKPRGTSVAGVDGCPGGWIAIVHSTGSDIFEARVTKDIAELIDADGAPTISAIDIPIGLVNTGSRRCDVLARGELGSRRSSVFPAPIRPILACKSRIEASEISRAVQGKGISAQAFGIFNKVKQVDDLLQSKPNLRGKLFEIHPELSFGHMFCSYLVDDADEVICGLDCAKRSARGRALRLSLVERRFGKNAFSHVRALVPRSEAKDDDILDAFAALYTACRIALGFSRALPVNSQVDDTGLEMVMYA